VYKEIAVAEDQYSILYIVPAEIMFVLREEKVLLPSSVLNVLAGISTISYKADVTEYSFLDFSIVAVLYEGIVSIRSIT
jgi:hypothetical protein